MVLVKDSAIHGRGVFSQIAFKKGDVVIQWEKTKEITQSEFDDLPPAEKRFTDFKSGKIFLIGVPERYVNHSCDHNTVTGNMCDIAARDINVGEEITADYSQFFILAGSFDCHCRSSNCRRIIIGISP